MTDGGPPSPRRVRTVRYARKGDRPPPSRFSGESSDRGETVSDRFHDEFCEKISQLSRVELPSVKRVLSSLTAQVLRELAIEGFSSNPLCLLRADPGGGPPEIALSPRLRELSEGKFSLEDLREELARWDTGEQEEP